DAVKRTTDVPYQVNKRPWQMLGLSVALGCSLGRLLSSAEARGRSKPVKIESDDADNGSRRNGNPSAQQLGVIKGATIGAMATILSELARHAVPTLIAQLEHYTQDKPVNDSLDTVHEGNHL